ncbi:NAD(P)/FAD-dependent oxidoreductase [Fluviicola sp.]|jgi:flavin-dependent dehydrogenase|uniref:NAD(P)/FAD-dependent oxidoreductase n=1 Tax=Fluviicola sp. TaxID=1917219 RepID=UPI00281B21F9|nr:NAD(P)/FAD-dependent oxidoreductase [Fluviicola sp.]MDR0801452.1 tryptophan 7-halogenase [Fluviicola sp.]
MTKEVDVVVIGAGPAGSVASSKLIKEGLKVLVLEKMQFPRFVIGESLLPYSMGFLSELGLLPVVEALKFQIKTGACFYHEGERCDFLFENQFSEGWSYTYQVKRADFDHALIKEVEKQGAEVAFQAEVTDVQTSPGKQVVTYRDGNGDVHAVQCRFVMDASGYGRVLPQMFNLEVPVSTPHRGAVFAHIDDRKRTPDAGRNIFVHAFNDNTAWIWSIPFSDGTASVGIVGNTDFVEECYADGGKLFKKCVAEFPGLNGRYDGVEFMFEPRLIVNYAVSVKQVYGEGYVLCGNSTEFLDPIFSSGVTLAIFSGYKAAALVAKQLNGESVDWENDYSEMLKKGIDVFRTYVQAWYEGTLGDIFFSSRTDDQIRQQICSVLAGYVWDETNPFVKKHNTLVNAVAHIVKM